MHFFAFFFFMLSRSGYFKGFYSAFSILKFAYSKKMLYFCSVKENFEIYA